MSKPRPLSIEIDRHLNAAYIELASNRAPRKRQVVLENGDLPYEVILDISPEGHLLGIEIIGAKAAFGPALAALEQRAGG